MQLIGLKANHPSLGAALSRRGARGKARPRDVSGRIVFRVLAKFKPGTGIMACGTLGRRL